MAWAEYPHGTVRAPGEQVSGRHGVLAREVRGTVLPAPPVDSRFHDTALSEHTDDVVNRESDGMNWAKARAYHDGAFVLGKLFSQVAEDVRELNGLSGFLRDGSRYVLRYDNSMCFRLRVHAVMFGGGNPTERNIGTFRALRNNGAVEVTWGDGTQQRIIARYHKQAKEVQWFVEDDSEPFSLEELTQYLLEPRLFS